MFAYSEAIWVIVFLGNTEFHCTDVYLDLNKKLFLSKCSVVGNFFKIWVIWVERGIIKRLL